MRIHTVISALCTLHTILTESYSSPAPALPGRGGTAVFPGFPAVLCFRLDQAVGPAFSLIDDGGLLSLGVDEYEEAVSQKLHLHAGIFRIHGLEIEGLMADDPDGLLKGIGSFNELPLQVGAFLVLPDDLSLVFLDLSLDDFLHQIDGYIHIVADLLGTDDAALDGDGHLDLMTVLVHAQCDMGDCILGEEFVQLAQLVAYGLVQIGCHFHVLANN